MMFRPQRLVRSAVVALTAVGALVTTGLPAQAYPGVVSAGSASCAPAAPFATVPNPATTTCTFSYVDSDGAAVAGAAFTVVSTVMTPTGPVPTTTDSHGKAVVHYAFDCSTSGSPQGTATGKATGKGGVASAMGSVTASCLRQTVTVTPPRSCSLSPTLTTPLLFNGHRGTAYNCSFTVTPAGIHAVSFAVVADPAPTGSAPSSATIHRSDSFSTAEGIFTAQVWAYDTDFTLTGTVTETGTVNEASAPHQQPAFVPDPAPIPAPVPGSAG